MVVGAKRFCHNLVIGVQKAALSTLRQKYSKFKKQISKFLNVLLRAERFFLQPWLIGVSRAALSTLRQKYSKILNSIFEISERIARS